VVKSSIMDGRNMWHIRGRGEVHTGFWWENTRKGSLEGNNRRWEDNIKIDFKETVCESVCWIDVAQVRGYW